MIGICYGSLGDGRWHLLRQFGRWSGLEYGNLYRKSFVFMFSLIENEEAITCQESWCAVVYGSFKTHP